MSTETEVLVVGAGMTGIGAGYYLNRTNLPYIILEGNQHVGGVWHTHRWHGVRCDSDFIKYSFSFKPYLSPQCLHSGDTIRAYLRDVAAEFSILEHIRFDTRVLRAGFDPHSQRWTVSTSRGTYVARFLINGNGYYSEVGEGWIL